MRQRFSAPAVSTISVSRVVDGKPETISLEVSTLPPGWIECLQAQYDEPERYLNGKPVPVGAGAKMAYKNRLAVLILAKALEPGPDAFDVKLPARTTTSAAWESTADRIFAECEEAGLTSAEVAHLYGEVMAANESVERVRMANRMARDAASGNSQGPGAPSP